jgi:UDP-N-acetylglucosamine diphosphorylase/glucosamine-1-phosphate N-acetyltransferase
MRLIIFESKGYETLYPLTYLHATFELRCGHSTLGEKIPHAAGKVSGISLFVRKILEPVIRQRFPECQVNNLDALRGDDLLIVDGRTLVIDDFSMPSSDSIVMDETGIAIARISKTVADSIPKNSLEEFLKEASNRLPRIDSKVTVLRFPWDLVNYNPAAIASDFKKAGQSGIEGFIHELSCVYGPMDRCFVAPGAEIHPMVVLDTKGGPVTIAEHAVIFPHTRIEGPSYIGPYTQIVGGKIREGCSFGPQCRVGGEVEESIIHGYSNKYHDGFLGHAYVGEWVNLGALTTNSDLKNDYSDVEVKIGKTTYNTGSTKVGAFIGDHTKTSIDTRLNTGSFIGIMCLLMASGVPLPKYIPSFTWYLNGRFSRGAGFKSLLATAHAAVARRKHTLSEEEINLITEVYNSTAEERNPLIKRDSKAMLKK